MKRVFLPVLSCVALLGLAACGDEAAEEETTVVMPEEPMATDTLAPTDSTVEMGGSMGADTGAMGDGAMGTTDGAMTDEAPAAQ